MGANDGSCEDCLSVFVDPSGGSLKRTLTGHTDYVLSVAVQGDYIVSGSDDDTIKIWNINDGTLVRTLTGHTSSVNSVAVQGDYIVSGSYDATIKI